MEDFVAFCKQRTTEALASFLLDLSFVPPDKLHWSPTPTAKSAFQIAAHCAGYSGNFAWVIREGRFPCTGLEFQAKANAAIDSVTTIEEAETMLRRGIADTIAAMDTVKWEQVGGILDTPALGSTPFTFFLTLPAMHLTNHGAQIDYLQTCWDDQEVHF